jgi:hypothetical protein
VVAGVAGPVLVDIDDTIVEVHGYAKQGAGFGYTGVRGLNALIATASTGRAAPVIVAQRLRKADLAHFDRVTAGHRSGITPASVGGEGRPDHREHPLAARLDSRPNVDSAPAIEAPNMINRG